MSLIQIADQEFKRLKKLSDDAVAQISESQFYESEGKSANSIAIIYKHMSGNMISRWTDFLTTDGEKPYRERDNEFIITESDTYPQMLERWEHAWSILFKALSELQPKDLDKVVTIRGKELTVTMALVRQISHYAYHIGQIVHIAKERAGNDWKSLSIPAGKSQAYNNSLGYTPTAEDI